MCYKFDLLLKTDFVSSFSCHSHSHSDLGNVYLLVLSKSYKINIAESTMTMTMTGKIRYIAPSLLFQERHSDVG